MKVLGATLVSLQSFVLSNFEQEGYDRWFRSLPEESREILQSHPKLDEWYPLNAGLTWPTETLCEVFYRGKNQGAWELGRYSADFGMNTLMKIFLKVTNVSFIVKRATSILTRYYKPCKAEMVHSSDGEAIIRVIEFDEMTALVEARIAGYMQRAAELTGGRNVQVFIGPSLTKAHPYTEFKIQWK